jgi:ribosomal protein L14
MIAAEAREHLGLPTGPVDNVVRTLERHGTMVVRLSMEIDKVDAFSVRFEDRPFVVLTTDTQPFDVTPCPPPVATRCRA